MKIICRELKHVKASFFILPMFECSMNKTSYQQSIVLLDITPLFVTWLTPRGFQKVVLK